MEASDITRCLIISLCVLYIYRSVAFENLRRVYVMYVKLCNVTAGHGFSLD